MNRRQKNIFLAGLLTIGVMGTAVAGNPERQGQAGSAQLTINGWARSSGMGWAYGGKVSGTEAMYMNVAGLDRIKNTTEMSFSRTEWLMGSGIAINNAGFAQKVGESGTFGIHVMQYAIKPIDITTEQNPYGGIGTFRVNMTNIGLAYSKSFSSNISAGIMAKMVSEGIPDAQASGIALDAGVQYVTTLRPVRGSMKKDDFRFGISMKNIGPDMQHSGDGLSYKAILDNGTFSKTVQVKVDNIKLPALLNIAASYDLKLDSDPNQYDNKLTLGFGFTNFAFSANQLTLAAEYSYKEFLSLRAGFAYQEGILNEETRPSAFTGPMAGLSYDWKMGEDGNTVSLDYSYRATNPFSGVHSFGIRIGLGAAE